MIGWIIAVFLSNYFIWYEKDMGSDVDSEILEAFEELESDESDWIHEKQVSLMVDD
jgi:hypothetical protein